MGRKSATDWIDTLTGSVESMATKIRDTAVSETRRDAADAIEEHFLQPSGRTVYGGKTPDECILDVLTDDAPDNPLAGIARLAAAGERFRHDGVSEDFRAGLLMAVRLIGSVDGYEL